MSICYCGSESGYPHDPTCPFPYYGNDPDMVRQWQRDRNANVAARLPDLAALQAENKRLREAIEYAMSWGIELGTADPQWVAIARAALAAAPAAGAKEQSK